MAIFVFPKGTKPVAHNAIIILPTTYFSSVTGTSTGDEIEGERITQFTWQIFGGAVGTVNFEVSHDGGTTYNAVQVKNLCTGVTEVDMTTKDIFSFNEHWPRGQFIVTGAATTMTLSISGKGF